jgi:thiol:disulfide interchange protein DsbD
LRVALYASTAWAQAPADVAHWTSRPVALARARTLTLDLKIEPGWHVYSTTQGPGGPSKTEITVPSGQPFRANGEIQASKPTTSFDQNFQMNTEFYEGSAEFQIPIARVSTSGKRSEAMVDVRFQACNERLCLPPTRIHVPVPLTGSPSGGR